MSSHQDRAIVSAILFYGLLTPVGLVMRLLGQDPLRLRFRRPTATYWRPRSDKGDWIRLRSPF
jgi:hypothetical protein